MISWVHILILKLLSLSNQRTQHMNIVYFIQLFLVGLNYKLISLSLKQVMPRKDKLPMLAKKVSNLFSDLFGLINRSRIRV